jgi:DNA-directed RNA polymerase specialized sigma24 family protein
VRCELTPGRVVGAQRPWGGLYFRAYAMAYTEASSPPLEGTGMAEDFTEEAQQVIDALKRIEQIEDPVERAVAISEVLADYKERAPQLRELQRQAIEAMRAEGVSYRKIADRLKLSLGAVQNIERGHGSGWGTKPRKKETDGG